MKGGVKRVLIYRLGSLGDTVVALPAFHLIRRAYPDAHITLLTNQPVEAKAAPLEAVLGRGYFFDEMLSYPVGTRDPRLLYRLYREIQKRKIEVVVHLAAFRGKKEAFRDVLFFRLAGVRRIIGFQPEDRLKTDPDTGYEEPEYRRLGERLEALGDARVDEESSWDLKLQPGEIAEATRLLRGLEGRPMIALSCGTKLWTKDWEEDNWNQLVVWLGELFPTACLVFLGAADEGARCDRMSELWTGDKLNLCGLSTPRVSAAVLQRAALFIGHDSGPLHLAACVGTPCVGIYPARNPPGRWFPRGERTRVIYHRTDCYGCGLEICVAERKRCILSIGVDEVINQVLDLLKMPPPAGREPLVPTLPKVELLGGA